MTDVTVMCTHSIACLTAAGTNRLLHPMDMNECPDSRVKANDIQAVRPPTTIWGDGNDTVLTNHRAVRDGSWWWCRGCGQRRPFGKGAASFYGECVPRRWGDQPIVPGGAP